MANTNLEEQLLVLMKRGSPDVVKAVAHAIKASGFDNLPELLGTEANVTSWKLDMALKGISTFRKYEASMLAWGEKGC